MEQLETTVTPEEVIDEGSNKRAYDEALDELLQLLNKEDASFIEGMAAALSERQRLGLHKVESDAENTEEIEEESVSEHESDIEQINKILRNVFSPTVSSELLRLLKLRIGMTEEVTDDEDEEVTPQQYDDSVRWLPWAMLRKWLLEGPLDRKVAFILGNELIRCESELPENVNGNKLHRAIGDELCEKSSEDLELELFRGITIVLNEMTV